MPRGNDAEAAGKELEAKLGTEPNAEEMIEANARKWPAELRAAQRKPINEEATAALDPGTVAKHVKGVLLDFAVRGEHVIAVVETALGDVRKELIKLVDLVKGKAAAAAEK